MLKVKCILLLAPLLTLTACFGDMNFGPHEWSNTKLNDKVKVFGLVTAKHVVFQTLDVMGPVNLTKSSGIDLNVTGPVELDDSSVDHLHATGPVDLNDSSVDHLYATGPVDLVNAKLYNDVHITGPVEAKNTIIKGDLFVTIKPGKNIILEKTKLDNMVVKSDDSGISSVRIKDHSVVDNVSFEGKHGVVYLAKDSVIKGKISGGKIVYQNL